MVCGFFNAFAFFSGAAAILDNASVSFELIHMTWNSFWDIKAVFEK